MSLTHRFALAAVALTMTGGAIVFTEPSPFDVLGLGLLILLPAIGLVRATPLMLLYASAMLIPVACAFFAILAAIDPKRALVHTFVSLFLVLISLVLTAFVQASPARHTRLIMQGTVAAGLIAASAGLIGYLALFPGASEIFTLYGRASGTFKDPNVFGAFLVMPTVYLMHAMRQSRGLTSIAALVGFGVLSLAILLSFSRGAWFALAFASALYAYLSFVTAETTSTRVRLAFGVGGTAVAGALLITIALQFDAVADLLSQRATLTQSYDEGPDGRFGGQVKARALILAHPLGLGAQQFDTYYHLEEAHNVYLSMFMNAGWLGGLVFALLVAGTIIAGARHAFKRGPAQGLFLVAYAAFVAHALEGFIIDLDHWRHFHVLMALSWGLMLAEYVTVPMPQLARIRVARALRPMPVAHIAS
jgi:hypothetical protein